MASHFGRENSHGVNDRLAVPTDDVGRLAGRGRPTVTVLFFALLIFVGGLLSGCVDEVPDLASDDPVLQQGREIYVARCVNCHGASGGGGLGSKLNDGEAVRKYPDIADQIAVVTDGKGAMASFKDTLTEDEITAVVRYTREGLS